MKTLFGLLTAALLTASAASAANLPNQCYTDAMGYANAKVHSLSANIVAVARIGEETATEASATDGMAQVHIALQATYSNGAVQDYLVVVPVQVDDENGCSVAGQASLRRLN